MFVVLRDPCHHYFQLYGDLHGMTNSVTEFPQRWSAAAGLAGNTALVCVTIRASVGGNCCW